MYHGIPKNARQDPKFDTYGDYPVPSGNIQNKGDGTGPKGTSRRIGRHSDSALAGGAQGTKSAAGFLYFHAAGFVYDGGTGPFRRARLLCLCR